MLPNWTHNGKDILSHDDFTDDVVGFIYCIHYTTGEKYIGKKLIRSFRRLKPTKRQLAQRKNFKRVEMTNLKFSNYTGSTKLADGLEISKREILELCSSKIGLAYQEVKYMFKYNVLETDEFINANILGKFFKGNLE